MAKRQNLIPVGDGTFIKPNEIIVWNPPSPVSVAAASPTPAATPGIDFPDPTPAATPADTRTALQMLWDWLKTNPVTTTTADTATISINLGIWTAAAGLVLWLIFRKRKK